MKLGIIRCAQTEDFCPGTADFKTIQAKAGAFAGVTEPIELIGFVSCGGCPGKKAVLRAKELVKRGADTIAFASCIKKRNTDWFSVSDGAADDSGSKKGCGRGYTDSGFYALKMRFIEVRKQHLPAV